MNELSVEMMEFLRRPNMAVLATLRKDGSPHQTVVWYLYEDGEVKISITDTRAKYRHVMRDRRVSLAIVGGELPYKEIVFEGEAEVTDEGGHDVFRRLAIHYYGEEEGEKYATYSRDIAKDNRLVLHLVPRRIMAWDFAVEDDDHRPWQRGYDSTLQNAQRA